MDKTQKFEYTQNCEKYLEDHHVYDKFEDLLQQLLVSKPDRPLDFLIEKLQAAQPKKFFLMGAPGTKREENANAIKDDLNKMTKKGDEWRVIHTGELLKRTSEKKTELGNKIKACMIANQYVEDEFVIEVVQGAIKECEDAKKSWILQGFPRTKIQSLALQKTGHIPDKFLLLNTAEAVSLERIKANLTQVDQSLFGDELEALAKSCLQEYQVNLAGVKESFNQFIVEHDTTGKSQPAVAKELFRMLNLRFKPNAPKRPPRALIVGPPGSGKDTQAKLLAEEFGLVYISTRALLKNEIRKNNDNSKEVASCIEAGDPAPDAIVNQIIEKRMRQSDCKVNGWVLEGFPQSKAQMNLLKALKIKPSVAFMMDVPEKVCLERVGARKMDPLTGNVYNLEINPPRDEAVKARLVSLTEDSAAVLKKKFKSFSDYQIQLEDQFKGEIVPVNGDRSVQEIADHMADALANPL